MNRKQFVSLGSIKSEERLVTCGVPQGSVPGPLLFLLYINDFSNSATNIDFHLFADDSNLFCSHKNLQSLEQNLNMQLHNVNQWLIQRVEDHSILQQDLFNLEQWASFWQMNFAPSKCYTLSVTLKKEPSLFTYSLCKSILEGVQFQKYLGVYITSSLSWAKQCEAVKKKANRVLGVLQRSLSSCSESVKERAYVGLVRPIAEYASAAWSPHTKKDTNNIESIQRRAARFVRGDYSRTSSVSSITRELGWASLQSRRTVHDLTLFYKIHSGAVIIQFPPELVSTVRRTRASQQHNRTFIHPCTSVDSYKYSFLYELYPTGILSLPQS